MQASSLKKLQLKIIRHHYGLNATIFFIIVKPTNATANDVRRWHNLMVEIADFSEQYGMLISILLSIILVTFALFYALIFLFDIQLSFFAFSSLLLIFQDIFGLVETFKAGCSMTNQCYPA